MINKRLFKVMAWKIYGEYKTFHNMQNYDNFKLLV